MRTPVYRREFNRPDNTWEHIISRKKICLRLVPYLYNIVRQRPPIVAVYHTFC